LLARRQVAHLDGPALRTAGFTGQGMRIAVFDVGFRGLPGHPAFQELIDSKRIVATHDFLRNRENVFLGGSHGTEVMGCLAGRLPAAPDGTPGPALGLAPAAEYLLARTEQLHRERYAEEEAWLAAVEWADRLGADVINSSLAYTEQRYFPEQMDGRRSLIARAANLAARKGLLVVSAAGNDGDDDWVRIGTPADADSALAVGGLDPETGLHLAFSSVGPTADRRLKPNLAAFGVVLTTTPGGNYERLEGTSFAAPLIAGLAACLWQQRRTLTAMQLFGALEQAGELYPYFDYAHGYGRPRFDRFQLATPQPEITPTFDFVPHDSLVAVILRPEAARRPAENLPLVAEPASLLLPAHSAENTSPASGAAPADVQPVGHEQPGAPDSSPLPEPNYPAYLYWNLTDRRGVLHRYETRAVTQRLVVQVPRRLLRGGDVLRVHFKNYTATYSE
ncbi:MAG: S8 family serine peptidase, partial [Bacteroidota bacterium]|nr:S8 family serine peptidase [Bacteroidota bacterium]